MEVNFNNLRKQACIAYDKLTSKLNDKIDFEGEITPLYVNDIHKEMDELRMMIGSIAMCYEEGNPDMIDVWAELYGDDKEMESFNPNTEE